MNNGKWEVVKSIGTDPRAGNEVWSARRDGKELAVFSGFAFGAVTALELARLLDKAEEIGKYGAAGL